MTRRASPSVTPRWYRVRFVSSLHREDTYMHCAPSRAACDLYDGIPCDMRAVKAPPRQWLERERDRARDTVLRARDRITLMCDTLSTLRDGA